MALIEQAVRNRPFFVGIFASACTFISGFGNIIISVVPFFSSKGMLFTGIVSDNGSGTSFWGDIAIDNFQINELPGCFYHISMQDSYGDGWNGASVDVNINGSASGSWALGSGSSGVDSLETLNGDVVDFLFTGGSWDSEITFQITDPAGNNIYNGGAPAAGSFLNHTSNFICLVFSLSLSYSLCLSVYFSTLSFFFST